MNRLHQYLKTLFIGLVRLYQIAISPMLGANCRFTPSCSSYAIEAIQIHGVVMGIWLAIKRVSRCHPYHAGGFDPVPLPKQQTYLNKEN